MRDDQKCWVIQLYKNIILVSFLYLLFKVQQLLTMLLALQVICTVQLLKGIRCKRSFKFDNFEFDILT